MSKNYLTIVKHYENCFSKFGDSHLGMDWPNLQDAEKRYQVMLDLVLFSKNSTEATILDFGCGTAHLLEYMNKSSYPQLTYFGLDISQKFIEIARKKHPDNFFYCIDIMDKNNDLSNFDYIVLNGVFTEKRELTFEEMWQHFMNMTAEIYKKCNVGFAFNVMSKNVDWEREDLFHLSLDKVSDFLCKHVTRNFIIRNDYGLYEYTVYVFKK